METPKDPTEALGNVTNLSQIDLDKLDPNNLSDSDCDMLLALTSKSMKSLGDMCSCPTCGGELEYLDEGPICVKCFVAEMNKRTLGNCLKRIKNLQMIYKMRINKFREAGNILYANNVPRLSREQLLTTIPKCLLGKDLMDEEASIATDKSTLTRAQRDYVSTYIDVIKLYSFIMEQDVVPVPEAKEGSDV